MRWSTLAATATMMAGPSAAAQHDYADKVAVETGGSSSQKSPEPTAAPIVPKDLFKRQNDGTNTCGFVDGNPGVPFPPPFFFCFVMASVPNHTCPCSDGKTNPQTAPSCATSPAPSANTRAPPSDAAGPSRTTAASSPRVSPTPRPMSTPRRTRSALSTGKFPVRQPLDPRWEGVPGRTTADIAGENNSSASTAPYCAMYEYMDPRWRGYTMQVCNSVSTTNLFYFQPFGDGRATTNSGELEPASSTSRPTSASEPGSETTTTTTTSSAPTEKTDEAPASAGTPVGAIVGGVVGGVGMFLPLYPFSFFWSGSPPSPSADPDVPSQPASHSWASSPGSS